MKIIDRVNAGESVIKENRQHLAKQLFDLVLNPYRIIIDHLSALAHNTTLY